MSFLKDIISKDLKLSEATIKNLIKSKDINLFSELCENAQMIFPFIQERIVKDFVRFVAKEDLDCIFKFSSIYCEEFQDIIVGSWLKFASEDLTDEILDLFEKGTDEQKIYCAIYFQHIKDLLALESLNKSANSHNYFLKINCAKALAGFGDFDEFNKNKEIFLNSQDEFEKYQATEFICAYDTKKNVDFLLENSKNSPFFLNIVCNILSFCDFFELKNKLNIDKINKIFKTLLENYPENIDLSTISYYQILDFIKHLDKSGNDFSSNLLLLAKKYFAEFSQNSNYTFDLDKNTKEYLNNIVKYLSLIEFNFEKNHVNYSNEDEVETSFQIVKEYELIHFTDKMAEIFNNKAVCEKNLALIAEIVSEFNMLQKLDKNILETLENANIKYLIENIFSRN